MGVAVGTCVGVDVGTCVGVSVGTCVGVGDGVEFGPAGLEVLVGDGVGEGALVPHSFFAASLHTKGAQQ